MNEKMNPAHAEDVIFSLDIGTRNVVGTLSFKDGDQYIVMDHEMIEHPDRSMFDGQIHDIEKVCRVAARVKEALEDRSGLKLEKVAIAAAGRALKTSKVKVQREIDYTKEISKELVDGVEMEAIQLAQKEITPLTSEREVKYYCVGYSVIRYFLDDSVILNPRGHRGTDLAVEVIATFLPHIVVDSLYSVMSSIGLEVINLTLEPIAAINVAIPDNLRLLNLALIDVGAGTSDIAITKDGTVVSYGMVAMAGDAITECIALEYLLDFQTAERVKTDLKDNEEVIFTDIVGMHHRIPREEILMKVEPTVLRITSEICDKVLEFNSKAPSAIFCIGGGCQIPGFTEQLADALKLPRERTVIKGTEALPNIQFQCKKLIGPEYVTPLGIGFTAVKERESDFLQVTVNDKPVRLFNSRELSVSDALVLIGYNARNLIASKSEGYLIHENGKERRIYGGYGEAALIYVNGALASLDAKLKNKDVVNVEPARPGENLYYKVEELIKSKTVRFGGKALRLIKDIRVNGKTVASDFIIRENDQLSYAEIKTVDEFRMFTGYERDDKAFVVNGTLVDDGYHMAEDDRIEVISVEATKVEEEIISPFVGVDTSAQNPLSQSAAAVSASISVETEKPFVQATFEQSVQKTETPKRRSFNFMVNGKRLSIQSIKTEMIFVDIFDHFYFDRSKAQGIVDLKLNGVRAKYTDTLKDGDEIEIGWR